MINISTVPVKKNEKETAEIVDSKLNPNH